MDDDIQKAIRLSRKQTTGETGTPNGCTPARSDTCRTSASTPSTLLGILADNSNIAQPEVPSNVPKASFSPVSRRADAARTCFQSRGSSKVAIAVAVSSPLTMPVATLPSHHNSSCASTNKIPTKNDTSVITRDTPPLQLSSSDRTEAARRTNLKKRRHNCTVISTALPCKHRKKRKRKKRKLYKEFMSDALRPKHTREEKVQMHVAAINKSLGGGKIPKLDKI